MLSVGLILSVVTSGEWQDSRKFCLSYLHPEVFRESTVRHCQGLTVGCYFASSQEASGRIRGALGTEQCEVRAEWGTLVLLEVEVQVYVFLSPCHSHSFISPRYLIFLLFKQA